MKTDHKVAISKLCRFCGDLISPKQRRFPIANHKELTKNTLLIDTERDISDKHLTTGCLRCLVVMKSISSRSTTTTLKLFNWVGHNSTQCTICHRVTVLQKGGRNVKKRQPGRPTTTDDNACWSRKHFASIIEIPTSSHKLTSKCSTQSVISI